MVVCNVYKLMKDGNTFVKNGMKAERTNAVMTRDYVEQKNENWQQNGRWFEIDEEATAEYESLREVKRQERKNKSKTKEKLNELLTELEKNDSSEDDEKKELRAKYKELYGKNAFGAWGVDKLKEKINEKQK